MLPESDEVRNEHRRRVRSATDEVIEDLNRKDAEIDRILESTLKWTKRAIVVLFVFCVLLSIIAGVAVYDLLKHLLAGL